jgi:transcriptional regulator with XRE-family HTH domain
MLNNQRVKTVREELRLNQKAFADKLAFTQSYISKLEKGEIRVTNDFINALVSTFGVNEEWLLTGNGNIFSLEKIKAIESKVANIDYNLLYEVISAVMEHLKENNYSATAAQKTKLITTFYKYFSRNVRSLDLSTIRKHVEFSADIVLEIMDDEEAGKSGHAKIIADKF